MKLEAGKFYLSREGKKIGPIVDDARNPIFPFRGGAMGGPVNSYREDGSWNTDGTESRFDLMRECSPLEAVDESGASAGFDIEVEPIDPGGCAPPVYVGVDLAADRGDAMAYTFATRLPETKWSKIDGVWYGEDGYQALAGVLQEAHDQAAKGKGNERHANGKPFLDQPIMAIGRMCGMGFQTGQMQKKVQEATSMAARGEHDAAIRELLGAINYAAAAVLLIRETKPGA